MSPRDQALPVERVEWGEAVVALSPPILLGSIRVPERRYAWVRLNAAGGVSGSALAFTRGLPVVELLPTLAALAIAVDGRIADFNRRVDEVYGLAGPSGVVARARSLVDLALWDLHGRAAGASVRQLLEAPGDDTAVITVAGYGQEGVDRDLPGELVELASGGCAAVKIELGGEPDAARDADRVVRAIDAAGDLGAALWIDVNGAWTAGERTHAAVRRLEAAGVTLIEEPYSTATPLAALAALAGSGDVQIAMGEFDHDPRIFAAYTTAGVDVCRADVTLVGGVDAWLAIARRWVEQGRPVFPHFYPEYHLQLVSGFGPHALGIEIVPEWTVRLDLLRQWRPERDSGRIRCPNAPGFGVDWDHEAIDAHTVRRGQLLADR